MNVSVSLEDPRALADTWIGVKQAMAVGCIEAVFRGIEEAVDEAKRTHRFQNQTGKLEASIGGGLTKVTPTGAAGEMHAGEDYASFVEGGTRAHVIRPKSAPGIGPLDEGQSRMTRSEAKALKAYNRARGYGYAVGARVLSWVNGDGVRVFARVVHHPGTRPLPFMGPAFLKAERVGEREIKSAVPNAQKAIDRG